MTNYDFVSCDRLFARIENELSSFSNNGLMDIEGFYPKVRLFIEHLGIAAYEDTNAVVKVVDYKAELPCDFHLLDSACLCERGNTTMQTAMQGQVQIYTEKTCETVSIKGCPVTPKYDIIPILGCGNETVLDKVTITEYIGSTPNTITWQNPVLLSLGNQVTAKSCKDKCANIFSKSPENISIRKQGNTHFLYSNLEEATIYLKYYAYPYDENNLPMIPDSQIFEEALFYDLMYYFFKQKWYNGEFKDVENKIKSLESDRQKAMSEAEALARLPSFRAMVDMVQRNRNRTVFWELNFYNRPSYR